MSHLYLVTYVRFTAQKLRNQEKYIQSIPFWPTNHTIYQAKIILFLYNYIVRSSFMFAACGKTNYEFAVFIYYPPPPLHLKKLHYQQTYQTNQIFPKLAYKSSSKQNKKTKHAEFSEKRTFLLRFALLPY